jgi:DNA-binding LytR/AlgR family response regulator
MKATALIAEDEPLLAQSLSQELRLLWPDLVVLATVGDGESAVAQALQRRPQVVFLDIRMPGLDGLQAAHALAEDWPDEGVPLPLIVFVTAYDQHAVAAFEHAAIDYVLKPVQPARLRLTCERLQAVLSRPADAAQTDALVQQLRAVLQAPGPSARAAEEGASSPVLRVLQASQGATIHMVPVDEVVYFEAADKYVRVVTPSAEHLLRMSLRELMPRLPPGVFWQVHRSTLVRAEAIAIARREDNGRCTLQLKGRPEQISVSRLYTHHFKGM